MATSLKVVLTAWCVLMMTFPVTANKKFCPDSDWSYYSGTRSCMKLFTDLKQYFEANNYCGKIRDAENKHFSNGHLVFIFDSDTDAFVKDLLPYEGSYALIGLNDRALQGSYKWSDNIQVMSYAGWDQDEPSGRKALQHVIITKTGWRKFENSAAYFICQVDAALPSPRLKCPAATEEGQESSAVSCTVTFPEGTQSPTLTFWREGSTNAAAACSLTRCNPHNGYDADVTSTSTMMMTSSLKIKAVKREDEGQWKCLFKAQDIPQMTDQCDLKVFASPEEPSCTHEFKNYTVEITCKTERVYPEGDCSWEYYRNTIPQGMLSGGTPEQKEYNVDGKVYYKTTCKLSQSPSTAGRYKFKASINPKGLIKEVKTKDVEFSIAPPKDAPALLTPEGTAISSLLEVNENQTVTIRCVVNGGEPPVIYTRLLCDPEIRDVDNKNEKTAIGQSVTMKICVTREMHKHKCVCGAGHIVGYTETTSVTFSVKFPAAVQTFKIKGEYLNIIARDEVTFTCSAPANPQPDITLYRVQDNRQLTQVVDTQTLEFKLTVLCNMSGEYACLAKNDINTQQSIQYESLKVKCPPEHCDMTDPRPRFGVPVGKDVPIKLCVFAYPKPTKCTLSVGFNQGSVMPSSRYTTQFEYTNKKRAEGTITLTIKKLSESDLGDYKLYTGYGTRDEESGYVYFSLVPQGPPACPTHVNVTHVYSDKVTLSWKPGFNGGPRQYFIIQRHDGTKVANVTDSENDVMPRMSYNVTGLSKATAYVFKIDVWNREGLTKCQHLQFNVSTLASPKTGDNGQSSMTIIIPVIIIIIIVIVVAGIAIFLFRKKRGKMEKIKTDPESKMEARQLMKMKANGDDDENMYANAETDGAKIDPQSDKKSAKSKEKKPPKMEEKNENTEEATYAQVNKKVDKTKKEAKAQKTEKKAKAKNEKKNKEEKDNPEEATYALPNKKKKDKQNLNTENVYSNETGNGVADQTYSNMGNLNGASPDDNVYANSDTGTNKETNKRKISKNDGRTVNPDGLIYVEVEINKKTSNPEIVSEGSKSYRPSKPHAEPVEYVSIDYTAKSSPKEEEEEENVEEKE